MLSVLCVAIGGEGTEELVAGIALAGLVLASFAAV